MARFDFYEFTGILAPGLALIFALSLIFPEVATLVQKSNFTVGDFGVVVVLSYIVGHLLQSVGNILEAVYWRFWGGNPTDWIRSKKFRVISEGQFIDLKNRLKITLKEEKVEEIQQLSQAAWKSIANEMYGRVKSKGLDGRILIFNGNYGLMRGVASLFLIISVTILFVEFDLWKTALALIGCFVLALARMHRFSVYYARELVTSYLNIDEKEKK